MEDARFITNVLCDLDGKEPDAIVVYTPTTLVPQPSGGAQMKIAIPLVHLECTTFMQGVDVVDQLRGVYSCPIRLHK